MRISQCYTKDLGGITAPLVYDLGEDSFALGQFCIFRQNRWTLWYCYSIKKTQNDSATLGI